MCFDHPFLGFLLVRFDTAPPPALKQLALIESI